MIKEKKKILKNISNRKQNIVIFKILTIDMKKIFLVYNTNFKINKISKKSKYFP